jgi:hypothetical protein
MGDISDLDAKNKPVGLAGVVSSLNATLSKISAAAEAISATTAEVKASRHEIVVWAMDAGDRLRTIQAEVGYGNFGSYLERHVACSHYTANKYMKLAAGRPTIAAKIATGCKLSITTALKLLRPPDEDTGPYSVKALAKLSPEKRTLLEANLGLTITRTGVPAAVTAELVQHAVAQAQQVAEKVNGVRAQTIEGVRAALATSASEAHQNKTVRALIEIFDRRTAGTEHIRPDRLAPESFFLSKPTDSSRAVDASTAPTKH